MSTDNDPSQSLPAHIDAAVRNVAPATDAVRDAHIATALRELQPGVRRRISPLSIAASIVLTLAVGATVFARSGNDSTPAFAAHAITPYVPTKGASLEESDRTVGANSCWLGDTNIFGFYTMDTQAMKLGWQASDIAIFNGDSCVVVGSLKHPTDRPVLPVADTKQCAVSLAPDTMLLAETSDAGYSYQVLATNTELMLLDCATQDIFDRIPHPNPEVPLFP